MLVTAALKFALLGSGVPFSAISMSRGSVAIIFIVSYFSILVNCWYINWCFQLYLIIAFTWDIFQVCRVSNDDCIGQKPFWYSFLNCSKIPYIYIFLYVFYLYRKAKPLIKCCKIVVYRIFVASHKSWVKASRNAHRLYKSHFF